MDFKLLTDIIEAYRNYQLSIGPNQNSRITDFTAWVNQEAFKKDKTKKIPSKKIADQYQLEVEISTLVICLNRYSRLLIKKGLINFPQLVSEDFTYLYNLMDVESMTKIQLIEKMCTRSQLD